MKKKIKEKYFNPNLIRFLKEKGAYAHYLFNFKNRFRTSAIWCEYPTIPKRSAIHYAFDWAASKFPENLGSGQRFDYWQKLDIEWQKKDLLR